MYIVRPKREKSPLVLVHKFISYNKIIAHCRKKVNRNYNNLMKQKYIKSDFCINRAVIGNIMRNMYNIGKAGADFINL